MNIGTSVSVIVTSLKSYAKKVESSPLRYRLAKGVVWLFVGSMVVRALGLVSSMCIARMLGKTGFGELGVIQSTLGAFGLFAGFGLGTTATKYIAQFRALHPQRTGRIIGLSTSVAVASGTIVASILIIMAPWLAEHTLAAPHLAGLIRIGSIYMVITAINGAQDGVLAGFEAFRAIATRNFWAGIITFPMVVLGVYFYDVSGAVWALVLGASVNYILNHRAICYESKKACIPIVLKGCLTEWPILWQFSLPSVLTGSLVGPVMWICNAMLVHQHNGYSEMGILNAANQWKSATILIPSLLCNVAIPVLSERDGVGDYASIKRVVYKMLQMLIIGSLPIMFIICVMSPFIMASYGSGFRDKWLVFVCLQIAVMLQITQAPTVKFLESTGRVWIHFIMNVGQSICLIFITALLIQYGALGLAIGQLASFVVHGIWLWTYTIIALNHLSLVKTLDARLERWSVK
ncbi:MAG: oligosaccharide flippase family protein [Armatimonadota bacterium]